MQPTSSSQPSTPASGGSPEALSQLLVIDRLEVGPVRVEPRRLVAPYRVTQQLPSGGGQRTEVTELVYKYEEDVFDPDDPEAENLAGLIAAQVALNYGLFCREIVFHSPTDRHDRRFLTEMARNTAREIYVNKLLSANPFITGVAADLPVVKLDDYLLAELVFAAEAPAARSSEPRSDPNRYAVLSSGGKESLLSYGLLDELGATVDPIFINESGGHWNTALRAYRHFKVHVPGTARVWINADRVFRWMLRWLPFVRQDSGRIKADIYPIRLWTVAVFSFGALPLMRKRGAGRLVIGDEHDTTQRLSHRGIPHYGGLYDQSRYFDNATTRLLQRKGWAMAQLSLLRPLSELLVERALAERYPELQRLQLSCHSARVDGEAVRPCGDCEKCRRVVAMLTALDVDPRLCGYGEAQIARCLASLAAKDLHQEREGVEQLAELLVARGALAAGRIGGVRPRARPEVLRLRFDSERSPIDGVPLELRGRLYELLLAHADGAVVRRDRRWIPLDLSVEPRVRSDSQAGEPLRGPPAAPSSARPRR